MEHAHLEEMSSRELNDVLKLFYLDVRKTDGRKCKTPSLENFRHSLNRFLQTSRPALNIIADKDFADANVSYRAMMKELKTEGLGKTEHYPIINSSDLQKLYQSIVMSVHGPIGLANKVQFDIRLYFCRRGTENIHSMTKETFKILHEPVSGYRYVCLAADEMTKNHGPSDKGYGDGAMMPEMPGNPLCPVASFEKYIMKLNPLCDRLWQRAKDSFTDEEVTWYSNSPVGAKKLQKFMSSLSDVVGLSKRYTNHSIRATGATILSRGGFNAAQIMSVTGHKSVSSLSVYQRVDDTEKLLMGQAIGVHVSGQRALVAKPSKANTTINYDDFGGEMSLEDFQSNPKPIAPKPQLNI